MPIKKLGIAAGSQAYTIGIAIGALNKLLTVRQLCQPSESLNCQAVS